MIERALNKKKQTAGKSMSMSVIAEGRTEWKAWKDEGQERQGEGCSSRREEPRQMERYGQGGAKGETLDMMETRA